jgi:hypothetical protein
MFTIASQSATMEVNGLRARINMPEALMGESLNSLPPHCHVPAYPVDEYPACPANWMHGSGKASSYFVPVRTGRGLWFDFTMNNSQYDIAIVVSVQGINPVTGKRVTELNLEQYRENCPIHNKAFLQDRFCPDCGYKWPAQNYIATTTGQYLWIDGFRNEKGEVRQYIITEDVARGVAAQVIGKDRVWAIGFAFYLSKEPRKNPYALYAQPAPQHTNSWKGGILHNQSFSSSSSSYGFVSTSGVSKPAGVSGPVGPQGALGVEGVMGFDSTMDFDKSDSSLYKSDTLMINDSVQCINNCCSAEPISNKAHITRGMSKSVVQKKMLEIGAGARINQEVGIDPNEIGYWQAEPSGMVYVSYCSEEMVHEIITAGKRIAKKDGVLNGLKVGN